MKKKCFWRLTVFLLFLSLNNVIASDVVSVRPLTNKIIAVQFDDGFATYHKKGENRANESVTTDPLNTEKAILTSNYSISSPDDEAYSISQTPLSIYRKSKGNEFTWICEWDNGSNQCVNTKPDHVKEHWYYLMLPEPMKEHNTYFVNTGSLAKNGKSWSINFDSRQTRSESIHVNILGYDPVSPAKFGYVYHWMGDGGGLDLSDYDEKNFYLIDKESKQVAYTGIMEFRKSATNQETFHTQETPSGNFLGAEVYQCDFSSFSEEGNYVLSVEGIGCSMDFRIKNNVLRDAFYTSVRGLFHNRSGIDLVEPYTEYTRPADHNPNLTPGFDGKLKYTTSRFVDWINEDNSSEDKTAIEAGILGNLNTWGWYQDAGDWDGYFSHLRIPALLMLTYEISPENFMDGELNLPEGINGIPDILDEASWLLKYFRRTRKLIIENGYGTGGIGARVAGDWFGSDTGTQNVGTPSYLDNERTWIVSGEDPFTTFFYSGLAAHYNICLIKSGAIDPQNIDWKKEAIESYEWAENNIKSGDTNPENVHGLKIKEYRMYAAASLYALTGEVKYHDQFKSDAALFGAGSVYTDDQRWGIYRYVMIPDSLNTDPGRKDKLIAGALNTADIKNLESYKARACRFGGDFTLPMLIGQATTPLVFESMFAYALSKDSDPIKAKEYLSCIYATADYFLGNNPLNMCWVTGLGARHPRRVFHMDSWYNDNNGEMVPGIIPYGPWRDGDYGALGPWNIKWAYKSIYPSDINEWPGHERWFGNYTAPLNAEFTIHQNTVFAAITYGFLSSKSTGDYQPNQRPSISITSPQSGVVDKDTIVLNVHVSDPDGLSDIAWVEYYNDWHKIGESSSYPFDFTWNQPPTGDINISSRIVDQRGLTNHSDTIKIKNNRIVTGFNRLKFNDVLFRVFPNPTKNHITFQYNASEISVATIKLYNSAGNLIYGLKTKYDPNQDQQIITVPSGLPEGIYIYSFLADAEKKSFSKQGLIVIQ